MYQQHVKEWRQRRLSLGADDSEIKAIEKINQEILVSASENLCEAVGMKFAALGTDEFEFEEKDFESVKAATDLLLFLADKAVGIE